VQSAVLPATTPERATDFFAFGGAASVSLIVLLPINRL
jgi:hypothetical protein